jgi:hypothetical protein
MSSYFQDPTSKTFHDGKNTGVLKFGDSQTTVNEKLAAEIESLKTNSTPQLVDDSAMDTDKLLVTNGFGSTDGYSVYQEKFLVTTAPKQNSIGVEYDLASLIKNSTVKTVSVTVEGKRAGLDAVLVKSDKTFSSFNLSPENFPASLSVSIKVNDGQSDKLINGKMTLNPSGESGLYTVQVKDFQRSELRTQTEVNNYLNSRVASIEKSLNSVVVLGNTEYTIQQALSLIWQEIQDLKNMDLSNIKVSYSAGAGNVTKTVGEALTDVYTDLNT